MKQYMTQRFSVKKFDPEKKVSSEQIADLIECFRLSPSSLNLQAWKLFVIEDEKIKERLAESGRDDNQKRIKECSHYFVLTRKKLSLRHFQKVIESTEMLQLMMKKKNLSLGKMKAFYSIYAMLKGKRSWSTNQVYIALGVLMSACAQMGIGSLPMEGIKPRKMDKILDLPPEYRTVVGLAVGYPHEREKTNPSFLKKSRFPTDEISQII